ncbi:MAG: hypothetical protein V6Z82_03395 [Flavobacteriales bacterium]
MCVLLISRHRIKFMVNYRHPSRGAMGLNVDLLETRNRSGYK